MADFTCVKFGITKRDYLDILQFSGETILIYVRENNTCFFCWGVIMSGRKIGNLIQ